MVQAEHHDAPWSASSSTEKSSSSVHDVLLTTSAGRSRRSAHVRPVVRTSWHGMQRMGVPSAPSSVNSVRLASAVKPGKGADNSGASAASRASSACASASLRRWKAAAGLSWRVHALWCRLKDGRGAAADGPDAPALAQVGAHGVRDAEMRRAHAATHPLQHVCRLHHKAVAALRECQNGVSCRGVGSKARSHRLAVVVPVDDEAAAQHV